MDYFYSASWSLTDLSYNTLSLKEKKKLKMTQNILFCIPRNKVILALERHEGEQMMAGLKITSPQNNQSP